MTFLSRMVHHFPLKGVRSLARIMPLAAKNIILLLTTQPTCLKHFIDSQTSASNEAGHEVFQAMKSVQVAVWSLSFSVKKILCVGSCFQLSFYPTRDHNASLCKISVLNSIFGHLAAGVRRIIAVLSTFTFTSPFRCSKKQFITYK